MESSGFSEIDLHIKVTDYPGNQVDREIGL